MLIGVDSAHRLGLLGGSHKYREKGDRDKIATSGIAENKEYHSEERAVTRVPNGESGRSEPRHSD